MVQKALMAKPQFQGTQLFTPPGRFLDPRNSANFRQDPLYFAISATLAEEDDFELGGEFLDVYLRAGERVAGFLAGCMVIAGIWILCMAL